MSPKSVEHCPVNALVHPNPYLAYALASKLFDARPVAAPGVHPSAVIAEGVTLAEGVSIAANVVIESGSEIRSGAVIGASSVIGAGSIIGENTELRANVTVYHGVTIGRDCMIHSGVVIGSDGFGFAPKGPGWEKIAQIGGVIVGDRVEIGANTTIDRGALDDTIIGSDVILDNQIQIAHNVVVGDYTAIAACTGIAGSTRIGQHCIIGGGCGISGHLEITDHVHLTGMTMVTKSVSEPGVYSSGTSFETNSQWRKNVARFRQLDELARRLRKLEKNVSDNAD